MPERKRSFAPVVDAHTRILILGSLPGERSLAQQQYYGHPQNAFWKLVSALIGTDLVALDYAQRLPVLLANGVGLWDVIADAQRDGSLDTRIREHAHNDLPALLQTLPALTTIGFNGGTAARIGLKILGPRAGDYRIVVLPSSSPAHTMPFAEKLLTWKTLIV